MLLTLSCNDVVSQLTRIYFDHESWHKNLMTKEEAFKYHEKLFTDGNIIVHNVNDAVVGYVEFWKINFEQFGRLVCHEHFSAYNENVKEGNIAYVANTWINPMWRNTVVVRVLKNSFFQNCYNCDYFVGEALRKRTQPIKVFKRADLVSKLYKQGE